MNYAYDELARPSSFLIVYRTQMCYHKVVYWFLDGSWVSHCFIWEFFVCLEGLLNSLLLREFFLLCCSSYLVYKGVMISSSSLPATVTVKYLVLYGLFSEVFQIYQSCSSHSLLLWSIFFWLSMPNHTQSSVWCGLDD